MGPAAERTRPSALLLVAALLALGVFVAGCGGDGDDETAAPPAETTAPQEEPAEPGDEEGEAGDEGAEEGEAGEQPGETEAGGIQVSEGDPKAGKAIFAENCAVCHGSEGTGGNVGPSLQEAQLAQEEEAVLTQIIEGGGGMPPFGGQLSDQEIADVAAFVVEDLAKR